MLDSRIANLAQAIKAKGPHSKATTSRSKSEHWVSLNTLQLATLLANILISCRLKEGPGWGDAIRTKEEVMYFLMKRHSLPLDIVESALWCANMLDEENKFFHLGDLKFDQFVTDVIGDGRTFDRSYGIVEPKVKRAPVGEEKKEIYW